MKNIKTWVVFFLVVFSGSAFAAKVTQVKNNKIMISLEGESASSGSEFFVLNASGKRVALVRVTQVKGDRAVAEITKGTAKPGYSLQARSGGGSSSSSSSSDSYYDKKLSSRAVTGNAMGFVGGYLMNKMSASFQAGSTLAPRTATTDMTGSGLGALGFYDYAISPKFILRGMVGMEQYNVAGSTALPDCNGLTSTECDVKITYLSFYGYGRYNLTTSGTKWWLGAGYGYLYAMSKSSTVLNASQISANQIFIFSLGADFRMSPKAFIPVSLEYGLFPSSDSVKANIMYLRAGYAWYL